MIYVERDIVGVWGMCSVCESDIQQKSMLVGLVLIVLRRILILQIYISSGKVHRGVLQRNNFNTIQVYKANCIPPRKEMRLTPFPYMEF